MGQFGRRVGLTLVAGTDLTCLVTARPHAALLDDLAAPHRWLDRMGPDRAAAELATAALWLVAVWIAVGLLAWAGRLLPAGLGRTADRVARLVMPAALYRLAAGAAGVGVLIAPVAAGALTPAHGPPEPAGVSQSRGAASLPAPTWPTDPPLRTPRWPTSPTSPAATPASPAPALPASAPAPPAEPAGSDRPAAANRRDRTDSAVVTVRPGDSLWSIAAAHLGTRASGARIGASWPRWYAANRRVIGDDPALIRPGQLLRPPARSQEDPS